MSEVNNIKWRWRMFEVVLWKTVHLKFNVFYKYWVWNMIMGYNYRINPVERVMTERLR